MDKRLEDIYNSIENLSDIRNKDLYNPVVFKRSPKDETFQLRNPITGTLYTLICSKIEPSYMGFPVNGSWAVSDPENPYYKKILILRDHNNGDYVTTLDPIEVRRTETIVPNDENPTAPDPDNPDDVIVTLYWHEVIKEEEMWAKPEYYAGAQGEKGDKGDKGDPGDPPPMDEVVPAVIARLDELVKQVEIIGPNNVQPNSVTNYKVNLTREVYKRDVNDEIILVEETTEVLAPIQTLPCHDLTMYMDANNDLHISDQPAANSVELIVTFPTYQQYIQGKKTVTIGDVSSKYHNFRIVAEANPQLIGTTQTLKFVATEVATSEDKEFTATELESLNVTLSDSSSNFTLNGAELTIAEEARAANAVVTASLLDPDANTPLNATLTITIKQKIVSIEIETQDTLTKGETNPCRFIITLSDNTTVVKSYSDITITDTDNAFVFGDNTIAVNDNITESGDHTFSVSYTQDGITVDATKTISITVTASNKVGMLYGVSLPDVPDWATLPIVQASDPTATQSNVLVQEKDWEPTNQQDKEITTIPASTASPILYLWLIVPKTLGEIKFTDNTNGFEFPMYGAGATDDDENPRMGPNSKNNGYASPIDITLTIDGNPVECYAYRSDNKGIQTIQSQIIIELK